jgi:hypothetical protein
VLLDCKEFRFPVELDVVAATEMMLAAENTIKKINVIKNHRLDVITQSTLVKYMMIL